MHRILQLLVHLFLCLGCLCFEMLQADTVLVGRNPTGHKSINDGDFDWTHSPKRALKQSSCWKTTASGTNSRKLGLDRGRMSGGGNELAVVESLPLSDPNYPKPVAGDELRWEFSAKSEYPCESRVVMTLKFGDSQVVVADESGLPCNGDDFGIYRGTYTITEKDATAGPLSIRFELFASDQINVYLDHVDLLVSNQRRTGPTNLTAKAADASIKLQWQQGTDKEQASGEFDIYSSYSPRWGFKPIETKTTQTSFVDATAIGGRKKYYFVVDSVDKSLFTSVVSAEYHESVAPEAPSDLNTVGKDWSVELTWDSRSRDIKSYDVFRQTREEAPIRIGTDITATDFVDYLPVKGILNRYFVVAIDHYRNKSAPSVSASATPRLVPGASFSDLLLPMPIDGDFETDLWGAPGTTPRDAGNGVESSDYSYWGGRIVKDSQDQKYHILIARWPESARKGHWEWPFSTVAHVVADQPTGPYRVVKELAYDYDKGRGHNPNITVLNDGTYMLHLWQGNVLTSKSMSGPWKHQGKIEVEFEESDAKPEGKFQFFANLSGLQREDGSLLFVSKFGRMMLSENGILGPYKVISGSVKQNMTIPEVLRNTNYEDPTLWRDEVQYHMIINAFWVRRAIYLRSPDGINWKYDAGIAYTPDSTVYQDGTRTQWYKLERPNVLIDEFGRATHLSLAACDVKKDVDFGGDNHSAKHIVLPLNVYKRATLLGSDKRIAGIGTFELLVRSEPGFDAQQELDLKSLRFGASEVVNRGEGCIATGHRAHREGLVIEFDASGNGFSEDNFAGKLIGRTKSGKLLVAYCKIDNDKSQE